MPMTPMAMRTASATAQNERVLCADGHVESEAQGQTLHEDRKGERRGCCQRHDARGLPATACEDKPGVLERMTAR
jgi:hypothetical protein